jgi:hypothetical protein
MRVRQGRTAWEPRPDAVHAAIAPWHVRPKQRRIHWSAERQPPLQGCSRLNRNHLHCMIESRPPRPICRWNALPDMHWFLKNLEFVPSTGSGGVSSASGAAWYGAVASRGLAEIRTRTQPHPSGPMSRVGSLPSRFQPRTGAATQSPRRIDGLESRGATGLASGAPPPP